MYTDDISAVKLDNKTTKSFSCDVGVKQGCMLSPTLFNLYISDLVETLAYKSAGSKINNEKINCLLYADDLVLFSETSNGLQDLLKSLDIYAKDNELTVNTSKTKIMIFNNNGKTMNNYNFYLENTRLENVKTNI